MQIQVSIFYWPLLFSKQKYQHQNYANTCTLLVVIYCQESRSSNIQECLDLNFCLSLNYLFYRCPTYQDIQKANCFSVQATGLNGDCCESIKCPDSNGKIVSVDPSKPSQFPVYGTYQPGYSGFRPNYKPPSTGTSSK